MKLFKKENDGTKPKYGAEPTILPYESMHYVVPLRTSLKIWLVDKLILGSDGVDKLAEKQRIYNEKQRLKHEQENANHAPEGIKVNHIAIILDDKVQEVIRANDQLADILLSNPTFVSFSPLEDNVKIGHLYVDNKFVTKDDVKDVKQ